MIFKHEISLGTLMNIMEGKRSFLVFRADLVKDIKINDWIHFSRVIEDQNTIPMDMYVPVVFVDRQSLPNAGLKGFLIVGIRQPGLVYNDIHVKIFVKNEQGESWIDGKMKNYSDLITYSNPRDFGIIKVDVPSDGRMIEYSVDKSNVTFEKITTRMIPG